MSLYVRIMLNDKTTLDVVAVQRTGEAGDHPDAVNAYEVIRYRRVSPDEFRAKKEAPALIEHRYGDGALVLARKALEAVT